MQDALGDRQKVYEQAEAARMAMPLLPLCIRLDGRCFSKWTHGLGRPFDARLSSTMIEVTKFLVEETNAKIGYTQSDEISLVLYSDDFRSELMFGGKFQKLASVLASMATAKFAVEAAVRLPDHAAKAGLALFDARVWNVPNQVEAANVFLWRVQDAIKNSISMLARHHFSHSQLQGKSGAAMLEMLEQKGIDWLTFPNFFRRGTFVRRETYQTTLDEATLARIPEAKRPEPGATFTRSRLVEVPMPPFGTVENRVGVIFNGEEPRLKVSTSD